MDREALEDLRRSVRRLLEQRSPMSMVRAVIESGGTADAGLWTALVEELGVVGQTVTGGDGGSWSDLMVVFEELGAALAVTPYFATVATALPVVEFGAAEPLRSTLLAEIAAGATATFAVAEESGWSGEPATSAIRRGPDWVLRGVKSYVLDGATAEHLLVSARTDDGVVALFHVPGAAAGVTRRPEPTLDLTRPLATVEFADAVAEPLDAGSDAREAITTALDLAAVALAAEQVGAAQRCLEMTVEHLLTRQQFGKPIGTFQALKHRCTDMFMELESARAAAEHAALEAGAGPGPELAAAASLAKAYCSDAFLQIALATLQLHGGMGYTWEHDAHLYLRRAKADQQLLGAPASHRERLFTLVAS